MSLKKNNTRHIGVWTASAFVISSMIGTGVFTSLGYQLVDINTAFPILLLWLIGGIISLFGAFSYSELASIFPRSGGEYNFLTEIYHPSAGFISGWISATIGFSAPTALAAITFSTYLLTIFPEINNDWLRKIIACSLVIILAFIHSSNRKSSGGLQMIFTVMKVGVIILFCFGAILFAKNIQPVSFSPSSNDISTIFSGSFAVSLIYVSYAYTGWNAATYLSSEIERPQKYLPLILISGTTIVTVLYILLNFVFLSVAPIEDMQGKIEIGFIAAQSAFGGSVANFTGLVLSLLLISTVSAMTLAGPRVLQVIGEDFKVLNILSRKRKDGIPSTAIYIQSLIAIIFILSSSFESILVFAGFTLALNSFVTVIAVFVLRSKQPNLPRPYKTFGYPFTPLIYLALTGWTLYFVIINRPIEVLFSLGIILSGLIFYYISNRKNY